jgi:hypothetical protein
MVLKRVAYIISNASVYRLWMLIHAIFLTGIKPLEKSSREFPSDPYPSPGQS